MGWGVRSGTAFGLAVAFVACSGDGTFVCSDDAECSVDAAQGQCQQ